MVRADKARPVAGELGAPIRTQGFAFAAAWRRQSSPCGLTAGARPLTSRCADGGTRRASTTRRSQIIAAPGRRDITTRSASGSTRSNGGAGLVSRNAVERGHRRHNGRARTIGQLCCSIARKRVRYLRRCRSAGDDSDACGRGGSLRCSWRYASTAVAGITTDANEAPSALADGAEARGSEKSERAASSRSPRSPKETHSSFIADRRTRVCVNHHHHQPTNNPRRGRKRDGRLSRTLGFPRLSR